jgi:hypothetical protein
LPSCALILSHPQQPSLSFPFSFVYRPSAATATASLL